MPYPGARNRVDDPGWNDRVQSRRLRVLDLERAGCRVPAGDLDLLAVKGMEGVEDLR